MPCEEKPLSVGTSASYSEGSQEHPTTGYWRLDSRGSTVAQVTLGPDRALLWGCPRHRRTFSSITDSHSLDASVTF